MKYALAAAALALAACAAPTEPTRQITPQTSIHRDQYCTDDPPPGAQIIGECPYGSGYLVSIG